MTLPEKHRSENKTMALSTVRKKKRAVLNKVPLDFVEKPLDSSMPLPELPNSGEPFPVERVRNLVDGSKWVLKQFEPPFLLPSIKRVTKAKRSQKTKKQPLQQSNAPDTSRCRQVGANTSARARRSFVPIEVVCEYTGHLKHTSPRQPPVKSGTTTNTESATTELSTCPATVPIRNLRLGFDSTSEDDDDTDHHHQLKVPVTQRTDHQAPSSLDDEKNPLQLEHHSETVQKETEPPPDISTPDNHYDTQSGYAAGYADANLGSVTPLSSYSMERPMQHYVDCDHQSAGSEDADWLDHIPADQLRRCLTVGDAAGHGWRKVLEEAQVLAPDTPEHQYGLTTKMRQLQTVRNQTGATLVPVGKMRTQSESTQMESVWRSARSK